MKQQPQGELIEKTAHDSPECGSSDALAIYLKEDGSHDGYCWSCDTWVPDPYGTNSTTKERTGTTMIPLSVDNSHRVAEIGQYPVQALAHRGLRADIAAYYGIRVGLSEVDRVTVTHVYYPMVKLNTVTAYKERNLATKDFFSIGDGKNVEMFGQAQALATGSKFLYITEGEDDAAILFQALLDANAGTEYAAHLPAVMSLPTGAGSAVKALSENMAALDTFETITLVFDNDKAGKEAVQAAIKILPLQKVKIAKLPLKDACDMYSADRAVELVKLVRWKTNKPKISSVMTAKELKETAKAPPEYGITWPWPTLTKLTYGIRTGQIIGVGAGVGVGKSSLWHQTQENIIFKEEGKAGLFMLEEPGPTTLKKLASKQAGIDFTDPDGTFTQAQLDAAIDLIPDDLCIYGHGGVKDWEDVKLAIKHMVLVEDVKYIFVDPLTALVAHLGSSEANDALNAMFGEISTMIEELDFTFLYGAHLNPPKTGPSHEEGGRVTLSQFTGSKAMIKWSTLILGIERDTQAEDIQTRNTALIRILKDRDFGRTGRTFPLFYEEDDGSLLERAIRTAPPISAPANAPAAPAHY